MNKYGVIIQSLPTKYYHDIITHQVDAVEEVGGLLERVEETTSKQNKEEQIFKKANLSPRAIKSTKQAKKGKKINREKNLPSRSQPKRG